MGNAAECNRCKGGIIWMGSVSTSRTCWRCRGTGVAYVPKPAFIPREEWAAFVRSQRRRGEARS